MNTDPTLLPLHPVVDVPQMLLMELAIGLDTFDDVCLRYGYTPEQTEALRADKGTAIQVSRMANELKSDGITFRRRAAHAAEDLVGIIWREARMTSTGLTTKLEALKTLAKLGNLEPKAEAQVSGAGFSITVNLPGGSTTISAAPTHQPEPIDVTPEHLHARRATSQRNADLYLPAECEYA